jgi:CheY-like chemotaxis protein
VRVVVADDVLLTRQGIIRLLRDAGIDVVAEADDAEGLLREVRLARPDVALVDIRMPPTHTDEGLAAAQTIRAEHPQVGVLVLSQYVEPSYALRLISGRDPCGIVLGTNTDAIGPAALDHCEGHLRCIAVLGMIRVERRANGEASSVMAVAVGWVLSCC